jgi:hypothetical protein
MSNTTKSIIDMVDSAPSVDNTDAFNQLWAMLGKLRDKVDLHFTLTEEPSNKDLQPYKGLPESDGAEGYMSTFAGDKIDWLVHSWVGNPKFSFTNMHLTISLGAQYDVPNLGLAFGTTPDLFFYMDYMPRRDLWTNPDYMDKYYTEANDNFLALQRNPEFTSFVSQDVYTRVAQTATSLCVGAPYNSDNLAQIEKHSTQMLERWLGWAANAEPTPENEWAARATRDEFIRHTISDRDPVNPLAVRVFGDELASRLIETLWGGNRTLPRAHTVK